MKTIILQSGTYAVDDLLHGFEIMEKPSSNVAFTSINIFENKLYVQFKNGSGYMYFDVDVNTLKEAETCESIGKFISSMVVKKYVGVKTDSSLILKHNEPVNITIDNTKSEQEVLLVLKNKPDTHNQIFARLTRNSQTSPVVDIEPEF